MKSIRKFYFLYLIIFIVSCKENKKNVLCQYDISNLIYSDSPSVTSKFVNDTIIEITDKIPDSIPFPKGVYNFDKKMHLRFYGFFVNEENYKYSESFDSKGNMTQWQGTPFLEYRISKKQNDTILFNVLLFALNKKYEEIEILTNKGDTIHPKYLFKANIYTNVKFFSFKLKQKKDINDLICYASGTILNTCTLEKYTFRDTTIFKDVKFN